MQPESSLLPLPCCQARGSSSFTSKQHSNSFFFHFSFALKFRSLVFKKLISLFYFLIWEQLAACILAAVKHLNKEISMAVCFAIQSTAHWICIVCRLWLNSVLFCWNDWNPWVRNLEKKQSKALLWPSLLVSNSPLKTHFAICLVAPVCLAPDD